MKIKTLFFCLFLSIIACEDIIEVEDISKEELTVLAPSNQTILDTTAVTFTWEPIESAETYHIQIATPNFENAQQIVKDSTLVLTSFSTNLEAKSYQWRIRAKNSGYVTDYTIQQFTIAE